MSDHATDNTTQAPHFHVEPARTYLWIFGWLMALLILTVLAARVPLGPFNIFVALLIAVVKALLVVIFFMHLRHATRLTWMFAAAALVWLGIMFVLTLNDYVTRGHVPQRHYVPPTAIQPHVPEH